MALLDMPVVFVLDDDGDLLSWGHVVVGLNFERGWLGVEIALKLA
jgi:hypothetical protein